MRNIITLFLNFKYFKKYLFEEINKKTSERILGKKLKNYVVSKNILNSKPNPDLLEKYKKLVENA